ncbi:hypothetical protein ARMGADRAFT_137071 [Armillaria gallica]|uniref:Uncharacterized protein n=1 Tax=Armillaria gallica TaxID=47427 RepID=A0A2H3CVQ0_ARMGA|nr:hypothetical protein ARMGADRAFT_137071 [Armillaria gallica]
MTSQSPPEISWPFSFVANGMPIPPEEAEKMFRVKINMTCLSTVYEIRPFPVNFIHNMCGFNPILDGADIRSYFDLFPLEIFSGSNKDITAVINDAQTNSSVEMFDPFESDSNNVMKM